MVTKIMACIHDKKQVWKGFETNEGIKIGQHMYMFKGDISEWVFL
jgi:hypothetical protein